MKKSSILISYILVLFSTQLLIGQGNYRLENFGNKSRLLNGNVTGSVEDLGLTYYNPSRLAILDNPNFTISGKAYQYNKVELKNAFGDNTNLISTDFSSIPSMVAGTFNLKFLPKHNFAFSFISRHQLNTDLNYDNGVIEQEIIQTIEGVEKFLVKVNLKNNLKDKWIGLTWAMNINEKFAIGVSSFFSLYKFKGQSKLVYAAMVMDQHSISYTNEVSFKQKTYGLFFKVGASWFINNLEMGLNIHLPYINIKDDASFNYDEVLAGLGSEEDIFTSIRLNDLNNNRKTAFGVAFGTGIPIGNSKIHLNVEWFNGISKYQRIIIPELEGNVDESFNKDFNEEFKPVINFGMGLEVYISTKLRGFLSFSSDYSAYKLNANLFEVINPYEDEINYKTDYWHFGLGFDIKLNWGSFVLGSTYASTKTNFAQPINFPVGGISTIENQVSTLSQNRWSFIIGIEIPLLNNKLNAVMKSI